MADNQLQLKWSELSLKVPASGFRSIRISSECVAEIFIGVNKDANRSLILSLPESYKVDIKSVVKENLSLTYHSELNYIVLQLTDNNFYDLFDDLVTSMYHRIKSISKVADYAKEFVQTFFKWSEFFDDKMSFTLSEDAVKGLFGELIVLRSLINETTSSSVNDVLNSWKGPYDQGHDFVLNAKDIEVKTKEVDVPDIKISSEFQLENSFGKRLELYVINVQRDSNAGKSIGELTLEIKGMIAGMLGDTSILYKAFMQKGLSAKALVEYDIYRFTAIDETIYNCEATDFPKIVRANIPKELNNVKYNIQLSSLTRFIISQRNF